VVVAAGHGIYYNHGFKDWPAQRDPSNGITEDFITPGYATELLHSRQHSPILVQLAIQRIAVPSKRRGRTADIPLQAFELPHQRVALCWRPEAVCMSCGFV
jgi:hypothetical protein